MKHNYLLFFLVFLLAACENKKQPGDKSSTEKPQQPPISCAPTPTTDKEWYSSGKKAPRFKGLDGIDFKIATSNREAQDYFNQGMMLAYGFNHAEAARSFYEATRLDSSCAMAFWGFAYVLGPNYNGGMEDDNYQRAWEAAAKAKALSGNCSRKEKALIEAIQTRYAPQPPKDRKLLDIAYSAAMKKVYDQYSTDPDIGALYAESLMDMHPWDLYDNKTKKARAWTPELLAVLELLIKLHPLHPGAHHFYIHALEASATPEMALESSKILTSLVPGSSHLLHMPSHIYINTGDYHLGSLSNIDALKVDSSYITACHAQGAFPLAYYPHNYHFLAATATLEGNSVLAWSSAIKMQQHTAMDVMRMPGWGTLQHYYTIPYYIAVKFAMWDTILTLPPPPKDLVYPQAIWRYAKGMAFLGKKDIAAAQKELTGLSALAQDSSLKDLTIWNINTTAELVQIAQKVLSAGIAAKQNKADASIVLLKEAVAIEDNLNYNEPPDWFFSVRHYLGDVLQKAGKYREAEAVYRQDLQKWRKNGWALAGLFNALQLQKKDKEAQQVKAEFDKAWQYADLKITASVID